LGDYCFQECYNLTTINIPTGVISLGYSCFCECDNIAQVIIEQNHPVYYVEGGRTIKRKDNNEAVNHVWGN